MRPGRAMRTRRAGHFIIFFLLLPYFISQFVNYRLWRREKTPVVAFYPDRLRIAYAGAKLVCPVLVQPVGADIEQQIERGMQALVRHPGVFRRSFPCSGASWQLRCCSLVLGYGSPTLQSPTGSNEGKILIFSMATKVQRKISCSLSLLWSSPAKKPS